MLRINTQELIMSCHEYLQSQHPRTPVTAGELVKHISDYYNEARDFEIEEVARRLYLRFGFKLADWFEAIAEKVAEVDKMYYRQLVSGDVDTTLEDAIAQSAAYALAVVLLYRAIDRGWIYYQFEMTEDEAAAWLDQYAPKKIVQASLFAGVL